MDKSTGIHVDHEWDFAINVPGLMKLLAILGNPVKATPTLPPQTLPLRKS